MPATDSRTDPRPSVVFVTAHPDDVAISFGGTAWLLKDRYRLHVICATKGERGYVWKGKGRSPPSQEVGATRAAEEQANCDLLGAELSFLGQIDGDLFAGQEVCEAVAAKLQAIAPKAVFTHAPLEKADHAAGFAIALGALHRAGLFWTTELYMAMEPGATYNAKYADLYVNISAVVEEKRRQIRCHHRHASDEEVAMFVGANAILGKLSKCDYAEAYMSSLALMAVRWDRPAGSILLDLPCPAPKA